MLPQVHSWLLDREPNIRVSSNNQIQAFHYLFSFGCSLVSQGLALHFLEQAQREIAEAEAADGKHHQHQQQQQVQQQPQQTRRQQPQQQQDAALLQQQKGPQPASEVSVRRPA